MSELARKITDTKVESNSLALFWLSQAGFVYKTPGGTVIYVDPYLTDCVEHLHGFKRLMATPIRAEEVEADYVVSTHAHPDHLDVEAIPIIAQDSHVKFVGAPDCLLKYEDLGLPAERYMILEEGATLSLGDCRISGVYADHGELAADALGVLLMVGDVRVWQVGDSAYRPERWRGLFEMGVDIIVPPINGAFGNLNGVEAAKLAHDSHAKVAIPCHFWMFAEHNGDPAQFLTACREYAPEVKPVLLTQGEMFVYSK